MRFVRFETKKQLREKIRKLESELADERRQTRVSSLVESAALPKCKGIFCRRCIYVISVPNGYGSSHDILGCGKDAGCSDFTPPQDRTSLESLPSSPRWR